MRRLLIACLLISACATSKPQETLEFKVNYPHRETVKSTIDRRPMVINRGVLNAVLARGPQKFISSVYVKPYLHKHRFVGYQILALFPSDPHWKNSRVKVGDVIISVNGFSLERPKQFMSAWTHLKKARHLTVVLLRKTQKQILKYRIIN